MIVTGAGAAESESEQVRIASGFAAYRSDTVRLVNRSLAGATHLVASRKGLFAVNESAWSLLANGFFFGLTLRGPDVFAFEACDQPHSPLRLGRIVCLTREGDGVAEARVVAKGLDNGCHQIDFLDGRLHVVDTYNQVVLRFDERMASHETLTPLPTRSHGGRWESRETNYFHVNSVLGVGDRILLLLHNSWQHTGRHSEVAVYSRDWQPLARWKLKGRDCHGLAMLEDGTLMTCDTLAGDVIGMTGGLRVNVSPYITRGLAVGPDSVVVGASRLANRADRLSTSGTVTFMDRDYRIRAVVELPGAPTEVRRLDGQDAGLSSYLQQVPWIKELKEGVPLD
jgi:hypothetical protein